MRSPRRRWPSSPGWPAGATPWGTWAGSEPVLAGSGSTWFVEADVAGSSAAGSTALHEVRVGAETARLVRARTVPAGWEGD